MAATSQVLAAVAERGLLPVQDKALPNLVTLLTGEVLKTSWWSHPKGRQIFGALSELGEHEDVLLVKLLRAKVTLVHRRLWPALLAVVRGGEPWQLHGLSAAAQRLLESGESVVSSGPAVKELESRLLVHTREVHTESGRHAIAIEPWSVWAKSAGVKPLRSSAAGKREIEKAVVALGGDVALLPWA